MRLTKQLVKRNASHLACTVQQMNGFCWGVSPGPVDRGLKSLLPGLADRRDKDGPVYFASQFFPSAGLFTTNPLGLRGAAGQVSNAAPPLRRPESLAALWREIKELDAALCVSEVTLVRLILIPRHWTIAKRAGGSLASVWWPGKLLLSLLFV